MLNTQKDLQRSHSFMVNVLIWQFHNSNCSFFCYLGFLSQTFSTGQQGKGEVICLTLLYYSYPLCRHLNISRATAVENSPLHIASSRSRTGNLSTSHVYTSSQLQLFIKYSNFQGSNCRHLHLHGWLLEQLLSSKGCFFGGLMALIFFYVCMYVFFFFDLAYT